MARKDKRKLENTRMVGSQADLIQERSKNRDDLYKDMAKTLETYQGGGACLVLNEYDENGEVEGATIQSVGVDDPFGQIKLAYHVRRASDEILQILEQSMGKKAFIKALEDIRDHEDSSDDDDEDQSPRESLRRNSITRKHNKRVLKQFMKEQGYRG